MHWYLTHQADPRAARLADKHYSRQKPGSPQFAPPGRKLVLITKHADAVWVTSWPFAEYVHRRYPDAWVCSLFRNESSVLSSDLIREAVAVTRWKYGAPPPSGMITMVDAAKVATSLPGYCYRRAKFKHVGETQGGLVILQLLAARMPEPAMPYNAQFFLFAEVLPC